MYFITIIFDIQCYDFVSRAPSRYYNFSLVTLRAATDESQKTRNKNQETKRFSTFTVSRLRHPETKKHCLIRELSFSGACAKEPINNLSQVTWLCTWLPK